MEQIELVWFRPEDYAGLGRRIAACLIDNAVIVVGVFLIPWLISMAATPPATTQPAHKVLPLGLLIGATIFWIIIAVPYHVGMRRTRGGTIGYHITGIRIIDMRNEIPFLGVIFKRMLISLIIPAVFFVLVAFATASSTRQTAHTQPAVSTGQTIANYTVLAIFIAILFATYWSVPRSPRRQAQHDRFSGTWLIRAKSQPAGTGVPIERAWILGPLVLAYWDVDPAPSQPACGGVLEARTT